MVGGNYKLPSEAEFNDKWITPFEVLDVFDERMANDHEKWELVEKLRAGQIVAVARTAQISSAWHITELALVYPAAWRRMGDIEEDRFWKTGHLVVPKLNSIGTPEGGHDRYFDIRFDPASFGGKPPPKLPGEDQSLTTPSATAKIRPAKLRGARRKDWWDLLWIEMFRRIRAGTLNPKDKADLQRTLEDYVDEIGGNYGDSTLKPMASNLFEYLEELRGK